MKIGTLLCRLFGHKFVYREWWIWFFGEPNHLPFCKRCGIGFPSQRQVFILELLCIWDETVKKCPELRDEYEIAHEWLTKTWTVKELSQSQTPNQKGKVKTQ